MGERVNPRKVTIYIKSFHATFETGRNPITTPPDTMVPVILSVGHKAKLATFTFTHWPVRYSGEASTVSTQDVLPEDQRVVVQAMYEAAFSQRFEIEVIDVAGRKNLPKELALEFLEEARFPVLVTGSGDRLEGKVSSKQIESFLSKVAKSS